VDRRPNILFIIVDELRYWRVFPEGINNVGKFLHQFMPNTYRRLWVPGVKFAGHYTAGVACTPARGTLITGRYTQQNWELATILDSAPPTPAFTSFSTDPPPTSTTLASTTRRNWRNLSGQGRAAVLSPTGV